jgi:FixJ family two-component response regulator
LQAILAREELQLPAIFISGINDVPASVRVMKAGAFDVLPKPVDGQSLLSSISLSASAMHNCAGSMKNAPQFVAN